jgi:bacteriocin-like protein
MKKTNIQKKKLSKKELKKISGAGPVCPVVFSCFDRWTGEELIGVPGIQGEYCC